MPFRRVPVCLVVVCLLSVGFSSCFARRRLIARKGAKNTTQALLTADRQTLLDGVTRQYEAVRDFNAEVDMVPALGTAEKSKITEYKDVRAYILFRRPGDIRLIGLYPVVRTKAFDIASGESLPLGEVRRQPVRPCRSAEVAQQGEGSRFDLVNGCGAVHRTARLIGVVEGDTGIDKLVHGLPSH